MGYCKANKPSLSKLGRIHVHIQQRGTKPISNVRFLPIIDLNSDDPNALFSLLSYISKKCDKVGIEETCNIHQSPRNYFITEIEDFLIAKYDTEE